MHVCFVKCMREDIASADYKGWMTRLMRTLPPILIGLQTTRARHAEFRVDFGSFCSDILSCLPLHLRSPSRMTFVCFGTTFNGVAPIQTTSGGKVR